MVYFKYKDSFKIVKNLDNLINNYYIEEIMDSKQFFKHKNDGDDLFCFIDPYSEEILGCKRLDWDFTPEAALEKYFNSQAEI
jgi:hypothetical protein